MVSFFHRKLCISVLDFLNCIFNEEILHSVADLRLNIAKIRRFCLNFLARFTHSSLYIIHLFVIEMVKNYTNCTKKPKRPFCQVFWNLYIAPNFSIRFTQLLILFLPKISKILKMVQNHKKAKRRTIWKVWIFARFKVEFSNRKVILHLSLTHQILLYPKPKKWKSGAFWAVLFK